MKTTLQLFLVAVVTFFAPVLTAKDEADQVHQAAAIMRRFKSMPETQIPRHVMRDAMGLAILTVIKGGFVFSGRFGEGVVVARNAQGWSGPAFINTRGIGFGAQIGGQVSELVLVLNTPDAVNMFSAGTNVQLGGALSVAAGPVGRSAEAGVSRKAAIYSYSVSQGLFAGVSLEGTVIKTNPKSNERYYQVRVTPNDILRGRVAPPRSAEELLSNL